MRMMTLPFGAVPSPHGHAPPRVTVAVMNAKTWPLPSSGRPARMPSSPSAKRLGHSQVMMRITTFAAHTLCNRGGAHLTQGRARSSAFVWPIASQSDTSFSLACPGTE